MEDPWSSPWTSNADGAGASEEPTIHLPIKPESSVENADPGDVSTEYADATPWGNNTGADDSWGGWEEAHRDPSPGWGATSRVSDAWGDAGNDWDKQIHIESDKPSEAKQSDGREGLQTEGEIVNPALDSFLELENAVQPSAQTDLLTLVGEEKTHRIESDSESLPGTEPISSSASGDSEDGTEQIATRPSYSAEATNSNTIDEQARPHPTRQSSKKVQELVEMYDGIANRRASPIDPSLKPPPPKQPTEPGVFSTTILDISDETLATSPTAPELMDESTDTKIIDAPAVPSTNSREHESSVPDESTGHQSSLPKGITPPAGLSYDIDMSMLDNLFPSVPESNTTPELVPDVIIDDTFASSSERKAWFLISRFGSIRKHNLGNDENYSYEPWSKSQIRYDTLKIVRRWMEQDGSVSGRDKTGRGGGMFNWDSKAPDVDVGELLLGRSKRHKTRGASIAKIEGALLPVASFGWNADGSDSPSPAIFAQFSEQIEPPDGISMPWLRKAQVAGKKLDTTVVSNKPVDDAIKISTPERAENAEESIDDDDVWGEMVASPKESSQSTFEITNRILPTLTVQSMLSDTTPLGVEQSPLSIDSGTNTKQPPSTWKSDDWDLFEKPTKTGPSSQTPPVASGGSSSSGPATERMLMAFSMEPLQPAPSPPVSASPFAKPAVLTTSPAAPATAVGQVPEPKEKEAEQDMDNNDDQVVEEILAGLHDLSYMLR